MIQRIVKNKGVLSQGLSVIGFASIYFFVSAVALRYSFIVFAWKFAKPKIEVDCSFWKTTIREGLSFRLYLAIKRIGRIYKNCFGIANDWGLL